MTSTFRTVIDAVVTDLTTNVLNGTDGPDCEWRVFKSPQFVFPATGPSLACWFETEEQDEEGPTGSRLYRELYVLRYWEPAVMDKQNLIPDDAAGLVLEDLYEDVRARLMRVTAQSLGSSTPLWILRGRFHMGGQIPEDGSQGEFTRGFELHFWSRRFREFTA